MTPFTVSEAVRNRVAATGASAWLDSLPSLVSALEEEWSFRAGAPFPDATEGFVARAEMSDGTPAVLKLVVPCLLDAARHEIAVLRLADGSGCARLLRDDDTRGALLLERLGRSMHDLGLPIARRHEILCSAASRLWRPVPDRGLPDRGLPQRDRPDRGLPTGADRGRRLVASITGMWDALGRPCSERAVDVAVACAERRIDAHDDERAVLVHGDVHEWNALEDPAGGFKLVDPDGLLAEAEYDMGVMMREDPAELMTGDPRERARWLARRCGLDATAIWEWGMAERVSTGLLLTQVGLQPVARQMLAAADRLAGL